ncbi:hypothetical protein Q9K01_15110 [Qipengyuania sp. DY56-A-20]|jgi:hypothetical protein|uniref:Nitrogen fixation protein n=1 Tax=Qipengyuania benthica TaxID=3067651 RepID=A0ABT9HCF9_9SPHN|nr:hypothetical protein [Qipengyuania sp. DY56-A-20]MDP4540956.1 hypothetical protein [Qipengyuania sp. DY56-A-20]
MKPADRPLCPSAPLTPKAQLFGVVTGGGQIAYLEVAVAVDARFIEEANKGREPERRFRFAAPCASAGCSNWNGGCTLPERVASDLEAIGKDREVPECCIRARCVWHQQSGASACRGCRFVVTISDDF